MPVKVTFDFGKKQITVEGDQDDLIRVAQEAKALAPLFSEIRIVNEMQPVSYASSEQSVPVIDTPRLGLRQFAKSLPLSNTYERIAGIAYYVTKYENKKVFSVREMNDWFGLCGFQKPALMPVALSDGRRKYNYVENKGRDQWSLTTIGENHIMTFLEERAAKGR